MIHSEQQITEKLAGKYELERPEKVSVGTIPQIFKELSKRKGLSIPGFYKKVGKELDITKVSFRERDITGAYRKKEYMPFFVLKKASGLKRVMGPLRTGLIFIPFHPEESAKVLTFAFKGYETDFTKIEEQFPDTFVSIGKEFKATPVTASDILSATIEKVLGIQYNVKVIHIRNIRKVLNKLTSLKKLTEGAQPIRAYPVRLK